MDYLCERNFTSVGCINHRFDCNPIANYLLSQGVASANYVNYSPKMDILLGTTYLTKETVGGNCSRRKGISMCLSRLRILCALL